MNKPKKLYKYSKIGEYTIDQIKSNYLWFSDYENLNDPFDLNYRLSEEFINRLTIQSASMVQADLANELAKDNIQINSGFLNKVFGSFSNDDKFKEEMQEFLKNLIKHKVCCFTTSNKNKLMWSHYADSYKGVCYEYDLSNDIELYKYLRPVEYSNEFPIINSTDEMPKALLRKSQEWAYEEEWRILEARDSKVYLKPDTLKGITFGHKVTDNIRQEIIETAKNLNPELKLMEVVTSTNQYDFKIAEIKYN